MSIPCSWSFGGTRRPILFPTTDDFFTAVLGPPDHDAHVNCWRRHLWVTDQLAWADAANESMRQRVLNKAWENITSHNRMREREP
jgi:hypothetical protein